jgi:hypothetical protein
LLDGGSLRAANPTEPGKHAGFAWSQLTPNHRIIVTKPHLKVAKIANFKKTLAKSGVLLHNNIT